MWMVYKLMTRKSVSVHEIKLQLLLMMQSCPLHWGHSFFACVCSVCIMMNEYKVKNERTIDRM